MSEPVRLSKLMAQRGLCSRREADKFIEQGMVTVNGEVIDILGTKVVPTSAITLNATAVEQQNQFVTILLNKPLGYVSGLPEKGYESAVMLLNKNNRYRPQDSVPDRHGLAPAGRLDIDSTGLIIFTQDGRMAKLLIGQNSEIEKEYRVTVNGEITDKKIEQLQFGLMLDNQKLKPAKIKKLKEDQLQFILTEGKKRQIRRMCELVDLKVIRLTRIRIGKINLGDLSLGQWRQLQSHESFN